MPMARITPYSRILADTLMAIQLMILKKASIAMITRNP